MEGVEMQNEIVLIPILRGGISMLETALKFLSFARVEEISATDTTALIVR
jgi:uracil phosphoribosyltransferase